MRLTLEALQALEAIAERGSFARAAEVLHRVPSALTYTMQKLESDLGVTLFDRSGRRPALTPAGKALLEQGRELLRQAEGIESRVKRLHAGWEAQLTVAVDNIVPMPLMYSLIPLFDREDCGTRLRFTQEVFGGMWDALIDRRADLAIGAPGDVPHGHGLSSREFGHADFLFACSPLHPLARTEEPIPPDVIARHRAVVVADSSRRLSPRTSGLQPQQETLVVPTLQAKIEAQAAGLGVGYVPRHMAAACLADGTLIEKRVELPRERAVLRVAWRAREEGRALKWWRDKVLADAKLRATFAGRD